MSRAGFRLRAVLVLCLSLTAAAAHAQVSHPSELKFPELPDFKVPKPVRFVLPNGMVVMVMEDHELPLVNVIARIRTGSLLEPAEKAGLAGLVGTVLRTGGTTAMTPDELDEFLEARAASVETGMAADFGSASMSALKADAPDVMKVFADVLRRPRFDPDRLKVAVNAVVAGIARQNDSPGAILGRKFAEVIYGADSPFARQPTYASIGAITRDDLVAWHQRYYHPNRIILGVVGDITVDEARTLVTQHFGDWPKGPPVKEEMPHPRPESPAGVFEGVKADSTQSFVSVGHQGSLLRTHPDFFPAVLLNEILSGSFTSRLFSKIRTELGLAYSVSGGIGAGWTRVAPFSMTMSTKVEATVEAIEQLIEEARALATTRPPTEAELELARSSILNSFIFNNDSPAEILGQQMTYEYYGQPLDWLDRYRAAIEKVTVDQVAAVAKKYIQPDRFAIVVVGPREGRDKPLSTLGNVTTLDLTIPEPESSKPEPVSASPEAAKQGRALLEKAVDAFGGAERLDGLTSYVETGAMTMKGPQGEVEIKTTLTIAFPDRFRQEMVTPAGTMAMVLSGDEAFVQSPQGERPLPASMRDRLRRELAHTPLVLLRHRNEPGFTATAAGTAKAGETVTELLRIDYEGSTVTLGIEPATGRILSVSYRGTGPAGEPADVVQTFSDFREVNGLTVPFVMTSTVNGEPGSSSTTASVAINQPVDPSLLQRKTTP
ncbi:MAG TPA: pitrilysin family protein [Vicinamibacterales bacterium]